MRNSPVLACCAQPGMEPARCGFQKLFCKVLRSLAFGPVPPSDPREPVLYVRCSSSDKALGGDGAECRWSPKIGAVMRTSLEGTLALDRFCCTGPQVIRFS